jgi:hypothetical protein
MTRRWPALVAIPALLVVGLLVDQGSDDPPRDEASAAADANSQLSRMMPTASGADALASTWFCAGGTAEEDGAANQTVVVYNPTDRPTSGTITVVPSKGKTETVAKEVGARSQVRVELTEVVQAPYASALVEFRGGEVVVEHVVRGPTGSDAAPCASFASDEWHFAAGASTIDADDVLVLFNPFPEAATVDISYALAGGLRRTPSAVQGLQVPARSVVAVSSREIKLAPEPQVSATVVARAGQVVVDRIQTFNGEGARGTDAEVEAEKFKQEGLSVTLGVPRTASTWLFPFGTKHEGLHERFVVYNPSAEQAEVDVAVTLEDPGRNGVVDPFAVTVNPQSWAVVDLDGESRIPTQVPHATVVSARNGVPVVAERVLVTTAPFDTVDVAITPGSPLVSDRWIFAAGGNKEGEVAEWISVLNPGTATTEVQLGAVVDGKVLAMGEDSTLTLRPGQHRQVKLPDSIQADRVTIQVFAGPPVAAERLLIRSGGGRTSTAMGVPAGDGEIHLAPRSAG